MAPASISRIPIKAYHKTTLRKLLMNPSIDPKDERALADAVPMYDRKFQKLLKDKLEGKLPESDWKKTKILPEDAVRIVVTPDPVMAKNNRYSRT